MCNIQSALRTTWRKPRGVGRKKNLLRGPVLDPRAKQTYQKRGQEVDSLNRKNGSVGGSSFGFECPSVFWMSMVCRHQEGSENYFFFLFLVSPGIRCRRRPDTQSNEVITMPIKSKEPKQKQNKSKVTTKQKNTKTKTKPTRTGQHERQSDKLTWPPVTSKSPVGDRPVKRVQGLEGGFKGDWEGLQGNFKWGFKRGFKAAWEGLQRGLRRAWRGLEGEGFEEGLKGLRTASRGRLQKGFKRVQGGLEKGLKVALR